MIKRGIYRNSLGVELTITDPFLNHNNIWGLGEIWWAENGEGMLKQRWLVTRDGLAEANYELIEYDND